MIDAQKKIEARKKERDQMLANTKVAFAPPPIGPAPNETGSIESIPQPQPVIPLSQKAPEPAKEAPREIATTAQKISKPSITPTPSSGDGLDENMVIRIMRFKDPLEEKIRVVKVRAEVYSRVKNFATKVSLRHRRTMRPVTIVSYLLAEHLPKVRALEMGPMTSEEDIGAITPPKWMTEVEYDPQQPRRNAINYRITEDGEKKLLALEAKGYYVSEIIESLITRHLPPSQFEYQPRGRNRPRRL